MTGAWEMFFELSQEGIYVKNMLGDGIVFRAIGRGTLKFWRESISPMTLRSMLFFPGMKKNLISVSTIEDI